MSFPKLASCRNITRSAKRLAPFATVFLSCLLCETLALGQDVRTYHNNNARTGLYTAETILTTANVNATSFGKLFTIPVDGKVDAQPLYLSSVGTKSGTQNLLIVATEHDSIYAFNADTGASVWHIRTLKSGETPSDNRGCNQVSPEIGITATPVIARPAGSNGTIYAVAMSKDSTGKYHQRLHAIDAATGNELFHGPVEINGKYPGRGDNSSGGYVIFDPSQYKERSGLLLLNGIVYLAWASHCDFRPYTGWIMGYKASTLAPVTVLNITPNGNEAAFWGSGAGLAGDSSLNIYALAANGVFDSSLNPQGFPSSGDYGNAFLKISTNGGLAVADYFEMDNQQAENDSDTDLGSGGALVLPNMKDSSGNTWQLAAGAGKDGNLYLVNRAAMGKFHPNGNNIYQELPGVLPGGIWSTPASAFGKLYFGPVGSPLLAFQFKNARLLSAAVAQSSNGFGYPGATPSISANGSTNAIVWAVENANPAVLHAYNASNLHELYNTNQAANNRDHFGAGNKFITPTIAHGKVYVGTINGIGVFGLLK
jgi:hypothetical protein